MICTANASGNIGEDVFVNEIMTSVHVPKPVRDISKPTLMREIRTAKRQVLSACAPVDAQLSAMEYVCSSWSWTTSTTHPRDGRRFTTCAVQCWPWSNCNKAYFYILVSPFFIVGGAHCHLSIYWLEVLIVTWAFLVSSAHCHLSIAGQRCSLSFEHSWSHAK